MRGFLARPAEADTYIGVNHAAEDFKCHYWAVSDAEAIAAYKPMGTPHIFTAGPSLTRLADFTKLAGHTVMTHEASKTACPNDRKWRKFTLTAALILAEVIGSKAIRLYGCDQQGGDYFKPGLHPTAEHFAGRWASEKCEYFRVVEWLKERHVHVERCFVE